MAASDDGQFDPQAPARNLRIALLADHPEAIPVLTEWFERDWAPYYGPGGLGNARQDLADSCNLTTLPIALVAFDGDEVCGTAALKAESVTTHAHLAPWLAALVVAVGYRRRGVAEQLIAAVEGAARQRGFRHIHVGTGEGAGTPESALRRGGGVGRQGSVLCVRRVDCQQDV